MLSHHLIKLTPGDLLRQFSFNRITQMQRMAAKGDLIQLPLGTYFFNHPDMVTHILQTNPKNYLKHNTPYDQMLDVLGPGVLTNDGPNWHETRQRLQPCFNQNNIEARLSLTTPLVQASLQHWQQQPLNIIPHMTELIMNLMIHILCGASHPDLAMEMRPLLQICNREIAKMGPLHRPIAKRKRLQQSLKSLDQYLLNITPDISGIHKPILTPIITLFQQGKISQFDYLSEMKNFFIAGSETTSSTLAWLLYSISTNPHIHTKLNHEIRQAYSSANMINCNTFKQLPYVHMCIEETMRLYPPIWAILRKSVHKEAIHSIPIAAKQIVMLCPYTLHRHPAYWQSPNTFMPEHFLPEAKQLRPKGCYVPYGIGPRVCIGKQLSQLIMKFILTHIITSFNISITRSRAPKMRPLVTLQPKKAIMMRLDKR